MTMKAGTYYVGDLCYVLHERWDEFCAITIHDHEVKDGEFVFKDGTCFATYSTAYGDGEYRDQDGLRYSVDAGLIGCVQLEDIAKSDENRFQGETNGHPWVLGHVHEFPHNFKTRSVDGKIRIGHVVIDTDPEPSDLLPGELSERGA